MTNYYFIGIILFEHKTKFIIMIIIIYTIYIYYYNTKYENIII